MISKLHYITQGKTSEEHLENIQKACTSGAELVQLNLNNVSDKKLLEIAKEARKITSHFQTRLLINGHYKIAKEIKADGVHLEKSDICSTKARIHLYTWQIIGATANTVQDCKKILEKQVDYITLSPFKEKVNTKSVLGLNGFTLISEALQTETPIIGFGCITTKDVVEILETGISGVAVSDEITKNFDLIKEYNTLLKASSTEEMRHRF